MIHLPLKMTRPAPFLTGVLLAVLLTCSCDSEPPTMCPTEGIGVLEGYVRELGVGVSAQIGARAMEDSDSGWNLFQTGSDSTGWYRLALPTGVYQMEVYPYGDHISHAELLDTIRVLPRVFRMDLDRGRAEVRVILPDDQEGEWYHLRLRDDDFQSTSESASVEDGVLAFDFPLLPQGAYTMRLSGGDLTAEVYLPHSTNIDLADWLLVGADVPTPYRMDFSRSYSSISGSITGSWQESTSIYNPSIHIISPDSLKTGTMGCHPEDGSFTCGFLLTQTVRLRSNYRGVTQWFGGDSFETATVFDLEPGDRITEVALVESGLSVQLDGPGDLAFHEPTITVRDEAGREFFPETYDENPLSICNLSPGRYFLHVDGYCRDEVWARQWYGGSETFEGAVPIDLAEGEFRPITLDLVEGGRIEGNVLRSDGTRPRWAEYSLYDATGEPLCEGWTQWRDFDEGRFRFRGLANGEYFLAVRVAYDEVWWYPGTFDFAEALPISIENHAPVTDVDWRLP